MSVASKVFKILTESEWTDLKARGSFRGSKIDLEDGFVHLATEKQINYVIGKYFEGLRPLYVAEFSDKQFTDKLKWEKSSSGQVFPHFYGEAILYSDVLNHSVIK